MMMTTIRNGQSETRVSLEDCFRDIIDGKQLVLETDTLNHILRKSLQVNINALKPKVIYVLPFMLVHFIKSWPGWQKNTSYVNKQITLESWYEKFKEYLIFKINYTIKNDIDKASVLLKCVSIEESVLFKIDNSTQTNPITEKILAPFSIEVSGPPKVLNSLVFCEGVNDGSVVLKEYRVNALWIKKLNTRQLINWPCIEMEFKCRHLHFKRTNTHDFKRCLTFSTEKLFFKKTDNFIEEIDILDQTILRKAYTLNAVKEYCNTYINVLRNHQNTIEWSGTNLKDIETILEDFILDIFDINMNSIATNTSVLFNIGNSIYARNKSIKTSDEAICFQECLKPRMLMSLISFSAIEDDDNPSPFEDLFETNPTTLGSLLPSITYRCTFCVASYSGLNEIWNHLEKTHIMEQPVLCFKCKLQFNIANLTNNRWHHQCKKGLRPSGESAPKTQ
ncbi:unnamed protein product [Phaedon cochleariae]|uniref:C2H2-type domain-containing protein n=1 Tax=Phaedon cochleariae TaxID=80249 RepID=A0A9P0GUJ3_PHACE|nr:unnamed protein product [Phaedon cochleariae]